MIRRWSNGVLIALLVAVTIIGGALTLLTWFEVDYAGKVYVSRGPDLPTPSLDGAPGGTLDSSQSFAVVTEVQADHSVTITEDIVQVFRVPRHGIERSIPLKTNLGTNAMRSLVVSTSSGTPGSVKVSNVPDGVLIRIGDADKTVTGIHAYRLRYVLENVVTNEGGQSVVRLDAISDWDQRIDALTYVIRAPGAPTQVRCFVGPFRSVEPCAQATQTDDGGVFAAGRPLLPGEGFTAEVTYPAGAFAAQAAQMSLRGSVVIPVAVWAGLYLVVAAAFTITVRRARRSRAEAAAAVALTFEGPISESLPGRMSRGLPSNDTLVVDARADAPLEFVAPLGLDPASLLRLRDATSTDVAKLLAATVVDLAADGMVVLERRDADSWIIRRHDRQPRPVRAYEVVLLQALLGDEQERELGDRSTSVSGALKEFMAQLDQHLHELALTDKQTMAFSATKNPAGCTGTGMIALAVLMISGVLFAALRSAAGTAVSAAVLGLVFAVGVLIAARGKDRARPSLFTRRGLGTLFRIEGFERFFRDSEAVHARAASHYDIYREYMGYAVALDHLDDWIGAMPRDVAESMIGGVSIAALAQIAYHPLWLASTRHYAAANAPKGRSFSGGGGFSGGGFSGGGSGGGGGGSW